MTAVRPVEKFQLCMSIRDDLADDPQAVEEVREMLLERWPQSVEAAGGTPVEEPTLTTVDNLAYGSVLSGEDGEPLRDEDGEELTDHVKFHLFATGKAAR